MVDSSATRRAAGRLCSRHGLQANCLFIRVYVRADMVDRAGASQRAPQVGLQAHIAHNDFLRALGEQAGPLLGAADQRPHRGAAARQGRYHRLPRFAGCPGDDNHGQ